LNEAKLKKASLKKAMRKRGLRNKGETLALGELISNRSTIALELAAQHQSNGNQK